MLPVVHIYLGPQLPAYVAETVRQTRRFHSGPIVCVGSGAGQIDPSRWDRTKLIQRLREVSWLDRRNGKPLFPDIYPNGLWGYALERFFVMAELMREEGWDSALQIENDVAIYFDPAATAEVMKQCFGASCAAIPAGPVEGCTAALFYVGSLAALDAICAEILDLLALSEGELRARFSVGMIHEMILLAIVQRQRPDLLGSFPVAPSLPQLWPFSPRRWPGRLARLGSLCDRIAPRHPRRLPPHGLNSHIEVFDSLFDASSFGQFAGGTLHGHPSGIAFPHHWLGRDLASGRFALIWNHDEQGRRVPSVSDRMDGRIWRLNNLHIHSKRIRDFV